MKKINFKALLPHIIAIAIFLIISIIYCKPALDGLVLNQHDINGWKGMAQNAFEYKAAQGHYPLWNPNLFSGMPNYQTAMEGKSILPSFTDIMGLGLPKPISFFFIACICFYVLCVVLRINPIIGILGSLGFAFSTYNAIIIGVGHESKMYAISFMPLLLAGMLLTFEKRYWLGLAVATIAAYQEIGVNHPQINFYFFIVAIAVTIAYLIKWVQNKEWKHILISGCIVAIAGLLGVAGSALTLFTSYEYSKATMRGGKSISIEGNEVKAVNTSGLDTSYAFRWSLDIPETAVMFMPNAFGGGSSKVLDENSHVVEKLVNKGIPESSASQLASNLPAYWGGMSDPSETTSGPPYLGAIICLLALIGFVIVKHPLRWGLLAATVLGIMMMWGKYFPGFNAFLFNTLPMYNKFRAPSMTMVIAEFTIPIMAVLGLQHLLYREHSKEVLKKDFKNILYAVGGLSALLLIMYMMQSYNSAIDHYIISGYTDKNGSDEMGRAIVSGMREDRKAMFGKDMLRFFGFGVFLLGLLFLYIRNIIKPIIITIALALVSTIEILGIDKDYLNTESFVSKDDISNQNFTPTRIDALLLKDTDPDFRVFNNDPGWTNESRTSYFHKSIGGYHPAKLRLYQDIIEKYLSGGIPNENILNMLNAKYVVYNDPKNNNPQLEVNTNAYGSCWLVKNVRLVKDAVEEIQAIGITNLKDTAIVQNSFSTSVVQPQWDSAASIKLTKFDNDTMQYASNASAPQFAVFSEVYYANGWNAYIDGKKVEYCKTDYVLRGLSIPAGQHNITFIFEPESYKSGMRIAFVASILILLVILGGFFMDWKTRKNKPDAHVL
jgi:hypothetical protein